MKKAIVLLAFLLVACSGSGLVCNPPYINIGDSCCLDRDPVNGVCDVDERAQPTEEVLDCSACSPTIISETEYIETVKYVCQDGVTIVDDVEECTVAMRGNEVQYEPVMTNEDDQPVIEEFTTRPACRGGYQAVEIHFKVGTAANDVEFQVKTSPDEPYEEIFSFSSPVFDKYLYGVFCDDTCTTNADFFISPGEKYLLRAKFDMTDTSWERVFYTNEHIIDVTDDGEYAIKLC